MTAALEDLEIAHDEVTQLIQVIPDIALDWQPSNGEWSIKQIIGHLAHANEFYIMIVEEARASRFEIVKLDPELQGWKLMAASDATVAQCKTTAAAFNCFNHTYQAMREVLGGLADAELDQPFVFYQPDREPYTTTLRQRVLEMAASHLREHRLQLSRTFADWRTSGDR